MKRWQRRLCRSSRTQAARWRRAFLTSNRTRRVCGPFALTALILALPYTSHLPPSVLLPVLQAKAKRGPPRQAKYAIHCINAMFTNRDTHFAQIFEVSHFHDVLSGYWAGLMKSCSLRGLFLAVQPLHKGLDATNMEQLITPLTTLGHLAQLAPEQFAAPLKSLVANFIVKDLLMNDRVRRGMTGSVAGTTEHCIYAAVCG